MQRSYLRLIWFQISASSCGGFCFFPPAGFHFPRQHFTEGRRLKVRSAVSFSGGQLIDDRNQIRLAHDLLQTAFNLFIPAGLSSPRRCFAAFFSSPTGHRQQQGQNKQQNKLAPIHTITPVIVSPVFA